MFRKLSFSIISAVIAVGSFAIVSIAQNAPLSGKVEMNKDGAVVPVEGAKVETFRTDIKGSGPTATTNKKGEFSFAGLGAGDYVLSVSGPGIAPTYLPNVKPGMENLKITADAGDGKRLTPEEVRAALAKGSGTTAPTGELTEEGKKQKAEYDKQVAAVTSNNEKIKSETAIIEASLKDGNAAYTAKDWDLAINKYNEGINANPTFAGSAPVLMNNKGAALRERAVITYNQNVKSTDVSVKVAAFGKVKADLGEAADAYYKSWNILKNAQPTDINDPKIKEAQTAASVRGATDTFRLMALTEQVDETKLETAKIVIPEYIATETDAAKKDQAKMILADLYRVTGDAANAIAEYRKVLEAAPDNLDAMAGLGLSLVNAGYINNDKTQLQEGANVLGKYAAAAPDTHKYKSDAVGLIESLKTEQKIAPQKVTSTKKKTN
ncbi:MAG TPA: carboxypeptidase regulatory-like domain-containing protein [Pyrinomonadaceae bacterium]|nr:carboxypeptidase regulatory-like domain-containing protein [Pyrinomonadaceae bacterium]